MRASIFLETCAKFIINVLNEHVAESRVSIVPRLLRAMIYYHTAKKEPLMGAGNVSYFRLFSAASYQFINLLPTTLPLLNT